MGDVSLIERIRKRYLVPLVFLISSVIALGFLKSSWTIDWETLDVRHGKISHQVVQMNESKQITMDPLNTNCTTSDAKWHWICMDQMKKLSNSRHLDDAENAICLSTFIGTGYDTQTSIVTVPQEMLHDVRFYADAFCNEIIELSDRLDVVHEAKAYTVVLIIIALGGLISAVSRHWAGSRMPFLVTNLCLLLALILNTFLVVERGVSREMLDLIPPTLILRTLNIPTNVDTEEHRREVSDAILDLVFDSTFLADPAGEEGTLKTTVYRETVQSRKLGVIVSEVFLVSSLLCTLLFLPFKAPTLKTDTLDKEPIEYEYAWAYLPADFQNDLAGELTEDERGFVDLAWEYVGTSELNK